MNIFSLLRWIQKNPKWMRAFDLALGLGSMGIAIWQNSFFWIIISFIFISAAIFRLGERLNFFLPKIHTTEQDKDA